MILRALTATTTLALTLSLSLNALADRVTIVSDRWLPYNGIPYSPNPGYMIEVARYGLEQGGHELNYQVMSWQRSYQLVAKGQKDCVVGAFKNETPGFVFPELHLGADQIIFVKRKDNPWVYENIDSLKNIRLGTIPDYKYSDELVNYIRHQAHPQQITQTKGKFALENNLSSLINGDIDAVVDSKNVLNYTINKNGWQSKISYAGEAEELTKIYIACSPENKQSKEYVRLIDNGLKALRANGQLAGILQKYGLEDWQHLPAIDN